VVDVVTSNLRSGFVSIQGEEFLQIMRCSDALSKFLHAMFEANKDEHPDEFIATYNSRAELTTEYAEKEALWAD
jgi:hypothetical protein